ncbi:unnamed protein product [Triticum turgidum subsp. durum]|uniref:Fungal lipase-type domain-containing protein n=1 Tax=Triticum turgidum subsp. durum TaxID=4567 RepID=A0A9R0SPA6_TRITD|nr:unnamed protein product [Triticum turgidum subsp. durum]
MGTLLSSHHSKPYSAAHQIHLPNQHVVQLLLLFLPRTAGVQKLIMPPEKARLVDIMSLLLLRRRVTSCNTLVDSGDQDRVLDNTPGDLLVALTQLIQKALAAAYYPAKWFGAVVEFLLNFVAVNGGLFGIIGSIMRCNLVIPLDRDAPNFRTVMALVDDRTELKPSPQEAASELRQLWAKNSECTQGATFELTVMAAKIAYENAAYIENVVANVWGFNFVGYYSCWNKFLEVSATQAFVMTDRGKDAGMVMVAFRGTQVFSTQDWSTDVNLSWLRLGGMGHVHAGFLKALGLQEEDGVDAARAFPRDAPAVVPAGKVVAYYELRRVLRELLAEHPRARVVVTGHSLGGALAVLFPAVLALHGEGDILGRLRAVHTYGQPRVGDEAFVDFFQAKVAASYWRVVYRYDVVPRVPFDAPPVAGFSHGGTCVYYDGWYDGRVLGGEEVPNPNYIGLRHAPSMYRNALGDLLKAIFLWVKAGGEYHEGAVSLLYRGAIGMLVPGVASHSPRDYVNAIRLGRIGTAAG